MKILLAINGTDFGGTETSVAQLAVRLRRGGHSVTVLSLKTPGRIGHRIRAGGVPVVTMGMVERVSAFDLVRTVLRLAAWLRRQDFDVLHSFLPRANVVTRVSNRLSGRSRPHISNEESVDLHRKRVVRFLNRLTSSWTARIVAVSPAVRDALIAYHHLDGLDIEVVENCVDLEAVDAAPRGSLRAELKLPDDAVLLCSVGRLVEEKGYVHLIRAFARVLHDHPGAHLVIVGDGPEEGTLRSVTAESDVGMNVHLLGYRDDILSVLKDVDIFVLSSLQEGLPLTLLEAMACSLPVVASAVGGIPHAVIDGTTGILVPPLESSGDHQTRRERLSQEQGRFVGYLSDAMKKLTEDPELRERLGRSGRSRVRQSYNLDQVISRFEEMYVSLLSGSGETGLHLEGSTDDAESSSGREGP